MPRIYIQEYFSPWKAFWNRWECWLKKSSFNVVQACLGHSFSIPQITRVTVRVDSVVHFIQYISSLDRKIAYTNIAFSREKQLNPNLWQMERI